MRPIPYGDYARTLGKLAIVIALIAIGLLVYALATAGVCIVSV